MAAGGDNQKLVRIFDQAHRSAGLTASAAKCFFGNHGILGDIFAYAALVPTRSRQDIPMFLGEYQNVRATAGDVRGIEDTRASERIHHAATDRVRRVVMDISQPQSGSASGRERVGKYV